MQGSRIGVDHEGFIRRAADGATVGAPYQPVVDTLRESWYRRSGLPIHGLYLVGSVAAGTARPFFSDLDVTLLLTEPPTDEHRQIGETLGAELRAAYRFVPKVDVVLVSVAEALDPANRYGWGFWFQHCCAWVAGADIIPAIRPFRPSWALSLGLNGDIQAHLERVKLQLGAASSPERRPILVRAFARKLVRTAFGLVSVLEQSWTDDLAVAAQLFGRHYPEHTSTIGQILNVAQDPGTDGSLLAPTMLDFGRWLADRYRDRVDS